MSTGVSQPPGLGSEPKQSLQHRQGDQLGIADPRLNPHQRTPRRTLRRGFQQIICPGVQCGGEGVQVGVHEGLQVRRWISNVDLGHPPPRTRPDTPRQIPWN